MAQASNGATAVVNNLHFHDAAKRTITQEERAAALAHLETMPKDAVIKTRAALPPGSSVPQPIKVFAGRDEDLLKIARALKVGEAAAIGQNPILSGSGGVGKSQTANEFAHRYGQYFPGGVFWLNFSDPDGIDETIVESGATLDLPTGYDALPQPEKARLIRTL